MVMFYFGPSKAIMNQVFCKSKSNVFHSNVDINAMTVIDTKMSLVDNPISYLDVGANFHFNVPFLLCIFLYHLPCLSE